MQYAPTPNSPSCLLPSGIIAPRGDEWPCGMPARKGCSVADDLDRLLNTVIEREILRLDRQSVELTAGPRVPGETIDANQLIERERERHRAAELSPAFATGLRRAYAAHRAGQGDLVLDDRRADENAI